MNILALDTSTSIASLALVSSETVRAESLFACDRTLSARLMPEILHLLELAGIGISDIDLFTASRGPGSFTGVRCGVATTQGLALSVAKPCVGFSSLAVLAMNCPLSPLPVCPLLDARKNEVYGALYDCSLPCPAAMISDCVMPLEPFLQLIRDTTPAPVIFAGEAAARFRDTIKTSMGERAIIAPFPQHAGRAANGALLALETFRTGETLEPHHLLPVYLRPSEAEYAKIARQHPVRTP